MTETPRRYTLAILEEQLALLQEAVFSKPDLEGAAYLLCGQSATDNELRFLVREVIPVHESHYLKRESHALSIDSASYASVAKKARSMKAGIVFVHSHPDGIPDFSPRDDGEEPKLMAFFQNRVPDAHHGSLVVSSEPTFTGRAWTPKGWCTIGRIRVIGRRFRFLDQAPEKQSIPEFFDRQVRAFGPDIQRLLQTLHVGVVGAGGTGSPIVEQLTRLGIGTLSIFDGDIFEDTNVNRVYGSTTGDVGRNKAEMIGEHAKRIGTPTDVRFYPEYITNEETAKHLRECDVVFGCTDKHTPRGTLVRLALQYLIPLIDTAAMINSENGLIREVIGRITVFYPGEACLFCRGRISSRRIYLEGLSDTEWQKLADEDYAPELETDDPAVITFTTAVASWAVSELLHRLTGFKGPDRKSSELLFFFNQDKESIRPNQESPDPECQCMCKTDWGRGDRRDFLGLTWSN
ncbi:hypothetical protein COU18_01935 [Candidatus Kaiserbacteria bacterium CG10_big_fil_rev_8_21_14_0_10_51_14]|uniref:THIF-type NAD/FAD binding fold domain-containing protein n=1 Tax=Candidatus Kaiserbacteria bacterium CG10_big_fil_rev_8_21_14_0_10_51_14 TaxID=1974610 RepID=A0A2H0UDZ6_9BACT|nr:MAG: hypothetical protein COU18_01935 [Candidatus Kaiserbacteria bacterium CG10_big_fil_rev_8_21_14_0_10_51_14]